MLWLTFPSTYQILQKHFRGPVSLQGQFLHFSISLIFWSLFSNPSTFPLFLFLFPLLLHDTLTAISIIFLFCFFILITIGSGRVASIRLPHQMFMSHSTLISSFCTVPLGAYSYHFSQCSNPFFLQICQWISFATLSYHLLYYFWVNFSYFSHVAHFHLFPTQSTQGAFSGLIDVVLHVICPDCLLLCGT